MIPLFAALQSTISAHPQNALVLGGLAIGLAFGFAAARTNFCVMGALSDWRASGSLERLGAVALAAAVAIIGAQTLAVLSLADLTRSMYLLPRLNWAGAILGGVLFGAGMVYAGGCASRNLIRAGGGDLRSVVVLVMVAVAAFAAISGVLGPLRDALEQATVIAFDGDGAAVPNALRQGPSLDWVMSRLGATGAASHVLGAALLALPLLAFALLRSNVLSERATLAGGLVIGALVSAGWWLTGAAYDDMALRPLSPASLTFVRPVADTIDWLQRSTALGLPGFGVATVFGTLAGSLLHSCAAGRFRLTGFSNKQDFLRHLGGGLAMGIGGVLALGCSIGQGLTGVSTLSLQSIIATTSIGAGALLAFARLERDM